MAKNKSKTSLKFFLFKNGHYLQAGIFFLALLFVFYLGLRKIQNSKFSFFPRASEHRIAILGDSISAAGTYDIILRKKYNLSNVISFASGGGQTGWYGGDSRGLHRGLNYQFDEFILKPGKKYDDIIVFGGVNDLSAGTSLETIKKNLQTLYDKIDATGTRVIAVSILPWKGCKCSNGTTKVQTTRALNDWIRTNAKHVSIFIDAYSSFFDPKDDAALNKLYDGGDGLHLSQQGNEKLAELIYASLYKGAVLSPLPIPLIATSIKTEPPKIEEQKKDEAPLAIQTAPQTCPYTPVNTEFFIRTNKNIEITTWYSGDFINSQNVKAPVYLDINCFAKNGSMLLPKAKMKIVFHDNTNSVFRSGELRFLELKEKGHYTVRCSSTDYPSVCDNTDSFDLK